MTEQVKRVNRKTLKLSSLEKKYKKNTTMLTHVVDFDTKESIKYYPYFSKTKVEELVQELFDTLLYTEKNGIDFLNNDNELLKYAMYLMIKHFTSFKDEITDEFEVNIAAMRLLYESGIHDLCFDVLFDEEQVFGVFDTINNIGEKAIIAKEIEIKERERLIKLTQNKEILGQANAKV